MEGCLEHLENIGKHKWQGPGLGCDGVYDGISCWEALPANSTAEMPCPQIKGLFDTSKILSKYCLPTGHWEGHDVKNTVAGYTEYKVCLTEDGLQAAERLHETENTELIYRVVSYVELVGITLSIICILVSLFIFGYHRSLRCKRTKIHLNLFIAILITSLLRLAFFIDRLIFKVYHGHELAYESQLMIINKAICPIMTALLEYSQLCNFMWMLNEGIYMNILLSYAVFNNVNQLVIVTFYLVGWGLPVVFSLAWALRVYFEIGIDDMCWLGYYDRTSYWIIKGPIFCSLGIGVICLINVVRILTIKLRQNHPSEIDLQIRKSAKGALLLLPLLGITHIFEMYYGEPENWILNMIFSVIKAILVFFQGVFLSIIYCFMNNEVKDQLRRHWENKKFRFSSIFSFRTKILNESVLTQQTRTNSTCIKLTSMVDNCPDTGGDDDDDDDDKQKQPNDGEDGDDECTDKLFTEKTVAV